MSHENQIDAAQTLGLIKGLTAVVQEQSNAMKDTTDQIKQLAATVENLMKSQSQPQSMDYVCPIWCYRNSLAKSPWIVFSKGSKVYYLLRMFPFNTG